MMSKTAWTLLGRAGLCTVLGLAALGTTTPAAEVPTLAEIETTPAVQAPAFAPWKAVAASGPVQALPAGQEDLIWRTVVRGDELQPATLLRTGRRGRATLTRNASLIIVDPSSEVELPIHALKRLRSGK